ncbi:hypothetical protein XELAEV_18027813mg [Xenopus laevis]|uniref:THAP4-like heme-binding domain-containing protein n=1 Tax=Xenopus laevis TaxID=8355 RepID=A0A974CYF9_XENLA|nr:hypothetical protein XELAEV_18027813mg [Xenopus laevis]
MAVLHRRKQNGGAGLPDLYTYWQAATCTRLVDCFNHRDQKDWIQIEQSQVKQPLEALPWIIPKDRQDASMLPITIHNILLSWDKLIRVVEVEEGEVEEEQLSLTSHSVSRISFAKEPHVTQGKLEQTVLMAAGSQSLAPHLHVTYRKVTSRTGNLWVLANARLAAVRTLHQNDTGCCGNPGAITTFKGVRIFAQLLRLKLHGLSCTVWL